jgi:hypothetical protein
VVTKPLAGAWRVEMRVPVARPALLTGVLAIVHDTLRDLGITRYELVLTPDPAPPPQRRTSPVARRLRVV